MASMDCIFGMVSVLTDKKSCLGKEAPSGADETIASRYVRQGAPRIYHAADEMTEQV